MLTCDEIKAKNIVNLGLDSNYSATSYDLTIEKIIDSDGNEHESFDIESGGLVEVISNEILNLPDHITALAHVKTGMSSKGLLALNIGMIDPGWAGPLSTTLVNFGDGKSMRIHKDDKFLRVTFHEHTRPISHYTPIVKKKHQYQRETIDNFRINFARDFLSLDHKITQKVAEIYNKGLEKRFVLYALFFTLLQIGLAYYIYVDPFQLDRKAEYQALLSKYDSLKKIEQYNDKIGELEIKIKKLETKIEDGSNE